MRVAHRVRAGEARSWDPSEDPNYEARVQRVTDQAENEFRRAEERLERARERRDRAAAKTATLRARSARKGDVKRAERDLMRLEALVEERRRELQVWASQMRSAPASSKHRGRAGTPAPAITPGELI